VGAVLDALERSGLAPETNVLFFSDHGESFFEHPGIHRHSYSLFEEELRVPLLLRVPGVAPRRVGDFVRTVDLLPTLLALHGIAAPDLGTLAGRSLAPLLEGGALPEGAQLAEIRLKEGHHANALLRGRYKLIEDVSAGRFALYDLESDPREEHDLAAAQPALVAELTAELRAAIRSAEERGVRYGPAQTLEPSAAETRHLDDMGYSGNDEPR
jgi:arylsulfatase A-like enzyme